MNVKFKEMYSVWLVLSLICVGIVLHHPVPQCYFSTDIDVIFCIGIFYNRFKMMNQIQIVTRVACHIYNQFIVKTDVILFRTTFCTTTIIKLKNILKQKYLHLTRNLKWIS